MTNTNAASAANDDVRPLDEAVIAIMRETVADAPSPEDSAFAIFGAAYGVLRGVIGKNDAHVALLALAAR